MQTKYVAITTIAILFLAVVAAKQHGGNETLSGTVTHVRDGDTFEVSGVAVRLNGVAAPELKEPRGRESKAFMVRLVSGKAVTCDLNGLHSYDRAIGTCYLEGQDIAVSIISAGLARDCARHSGGRYDEFDTAASKRLPLPGYCAPR